MNFYSINDFNTIPKERLAEIKKYANATYNKFFINKYFNSSNFIQTIDIYWTSSKKKKCK